MTNYPLLLYIDPGTGAMLFSVLMGIVGVLFYALKGAIIKIRFILSGGKVTSSSDNKIPLVIFSDNKRYWNCFKAICEELEKRQFKCEYWTASPDDPALSEKYEYVKTMFIGEGNKAFAKLNLMNAYMCLSTTPGLDVYQWKRSKNTDCYIHIFHNFAEPLLYRMFGIDYYDVILASGNEEERYIRRLEKHWNSDEKEIKVVGLPYLDDLLRRKQEFEKNNLNTSNENVVVLLAPSWGESSITNKYGEKFINALINTGYNIIYRPHPQSFTADKELMDNLMNKFPDNDKFTWDKNPDNFESLNKADILISDFSGIIYDFSLCFDKPVMYANSGFDPSPYDSYWLNGDSWSVSNLPNVGKELNEDDFNNLKSVIDDLLSNSDYKSSRNNIKKEAWKNIGTSHIAAADYLIEKYNSLVDSENT